MCLCLTYSILDLKHFLYGVIVEDESNDCVTQRLQLVNFNEITFQNKSVDLSHNNKSPFIQRRQLV